MREGWDDGPQIATGLLMLFFSPFCPLSLFQSFWLSVFIRHTHPPTPLPPNYGRKNNNRNSILCTSLHDSARKCRSLLPLWPCGYLRNHLIIYRPLFIYYLYCHMNVFFVCLFNKNMSTIIISRSLRVYLCTFSSHLFMCV